MRTIDKLFLVATAVGSSATVRAEPILSALARARGSKPVLLYVVPDTRVQAPADADIATLAKVLGMKVVTFGNVEGLAPNVTRVFRTPPLNRGDPLKGATSEQILKLLLGSLDTKQWAALESSTGVGLANMRTDAQRTLFLGLVSGDDSITVRGTDAKHDSKTVPGGPGTRRLRLSRTAHVYAQVMVSGRPTFVGKEDLSRYVLDPRRSAEPESLGGDPSFVTLPNAPQFLPFDLTGRSMMQMVGARDLARVRTMGALTETLRRATGLDLYVDARYRDLPVYVNARTAASVGDLMRVALLGLGATVRRVGSAYVIVDSLAGIGARQEAWRRFREGQEGVRRTLLAQTEPAIAQAFRPESVYPDESPRRLTASQVEAAQKGANPLGLLDLKTTYGDLTPEQQEAARESQAQAQRYMRAVASSLALDSVVRLTERADLQMLVEGLNDPVSMVDAANFLDTLAANARRLGSARSNVGASSLGGRLATFAERAALFDAATMPTGGGRYAALRATGFTTVWVAAPVDDLLDGGERTVRLRRVFEAAHEAGLAAKLVFQPLVRRTGLAEGAYDRAIAGELAALDPVTPKREALYWVQPSLNGDLPDARRLIDVIATIPHLKGVVLERTVAPGYMVPIGLQEDSSQDFGYTEALRLRFLRAHSIDPIDLPMRYPTLREIDFRPPLLADLSDETTKAAYEAWSRDRAMLNEASVQGFARLLNAVAKACGWESVFVRQRRSPPGEAWYGEWVGTEPLLPGSMAEDARTRWSVEPSLSAFLAHESARAIVQLPPTANRSALASALDRLAQTYKGGVVLDFRGAIGRGLPFEELVDSLKDAPTQ